jgi:hypothetical protein
MTGTSFRLNETVLIEAEMEGIDSSISDVDIEIRHSVTDAVAVSGTEMQEAGNQKYKYFWDTRIGYSGFSGWSAYSAYNNPTPGGPVIYSGWSGTCGYSCGVSGLYTAKITARDANDRYGEEVFKIRIG